MSGTVEAARANLRKALIEAYVVETALPPEMAQILEMLSQPAPPPRRFGRRR